MRLRTLLALLFLSSVAWAAPASYDHCVNTLYKSGGMSLRESQVECLGFPSDEALKCQNTLFQIAYKTPQESWQQCLANSRADQFFRGNLYRGEFEPIPAGQKKTVCTITVNSKEEKESFRRKLPEQEYDFVELLPHADAARFVTRDNYWLQRACEQKVRCDILVFSGHFAESFIGDSGFEVSMQDLKNYKQQNACGSFFDSIKEVYLFGCNTLAQKNADHRSIQQYVRILVEDGVSPHTAQRISARRYTKYDHSVAEKMGEIFSQAVFVTGFPSVGPTGKRVQPTLEKYLSEAFAKAENKPEEKIKAFSNSLGRLGMIHLSRQQMAPVRSEGRLLKDSKLMNLSDITRFTSAYALDLPVAVVDILKSGMQEGLVPASEVPLIQKNLNRLWSKMTLENQKLNLCPLLLAGHSEWVPEDLDCQSDTQWLAGR